MHLIVRCAAVIVAAGCWASATQADDSALCSGNEGTRDDRIAACTRLIEQDKVEGAGLAQALQNRGMDHAARGDLARAIADYSRAIESIRRRRLRSSLAPTPMLR